MLKYLEVMCHICNLLSSHLEKKKTVDRYGHGDTDTHVLSIAKRESKPV